MKCPECGLTIADNSQAFLLHRAMRGGDERYCQCNDAGEGKKKIPPEIMKAALKFKKQIERDGAKLSVKDKTIVIDYGGKDDG